MQRYNPKEIEPKWQEIWDETGVYTTDLESKKPKYIAMSMFNYPSGAGIHIGHAMNYTISDVKARFKRQQGYESYHPIGWDSFGLPAENYAIKTGVSPQVSMARIIPGYHKQYKAMGWSNDWEKEIATHLPEYYKWTQWIFVQMHKHGLAYQDIRMQWWCTKCQTVLANEQVIDGKCWRHDAADDPIVEKREIKQWFFKITEYADELLDAIDGLDWTESVKLAQANWIGRSVGADIRFAVAKDGHTQATAPRSYIIGMGNLSSDLAKLGVEIVEKMPNGNMKAVIPETVLTEYEHLIGEKIKPGYWNEYLTDNEVVFIFKDKNGKLERIVWDEHDDQALLKRCMEYSNEQFESIRSMLDANDWYRGHVPLSAITVFTTRPDTIYGATYIVVAPEHTLLERLTIPEQQQAVSAYVREAQKKTDVERQEGKEKTGVFTGSYAINPVNGAKLPVWVADYVLVSYGTGAVMGVPAHDDRDHEFAKKFSLPIVPVVAPAFGREIVYGSDVQDRPVVDIILHDPKTDKYCLLNWKEGAPRKDAGIDLPGGGIDDGETVEQGALRETREETGYTDIKITRILPATVAVYYADHYDDGTSRPRRAVKQIALAELLSDKNVGLDSAEDYEKGWYNIMWMTRNEIEKSNIWEGVKVFFDIAFGSTIHIGEGVLVNSGAYDNLPTSEAREKIVADLKKQGVARERVNYKMRDWSVSRQRYWGAPIPIIECPNPKCGAQLVPEDQLPVLLPELNDFQPNGDGRSALARAKDWLEVTCPNCGGPAERETDTLDTYLDSSWYWYRYMDPHNKHEIFRSEIAKKWEPVDFYNGADHATAHLLYARFIARFFTKLGLVNDPEPFKQFLFNGKITAADGQMFSKSKGNGIDPLEIINQGYGADALRAYLMFASPLELWTRWDPQGVPGTYRFLSRIWNLVGEYNEVKSTVELSSEEERAIRRATHRMIKKMTEDIEANRYNTAIAAAMGTVNELYKLKTEGLGKHDAWHEALVSVVACIAPFAPHIAEELWFQLGHSSTVHRDSWPKYDEKYLAEDTITIVVQINGKVRAELQVAKDTPEADITAAAKAHERVIPHIDGKEIKKTIYIPGKLVSLVTS